VKAARVPRVWVPETIAVDNDASSTSNRLELPKRVAHHLLTVLRASDGDAIELFNGDGNNYAARLQRVGKKAFAVIESATQNKAESPLRTTLVQCISRGDRMDTSVQKSVELGVNEIQPLYSNFSVPVLKNDRALKKLEHWQAIAISAAEQCGRSHIPTVCVPQPLNKWLMASWPDCRASGTIGWVLDPTAQLNLAESCATLEAQAPTHHLILIGPETGLSNDEINTAVTAGFKAIRFGRRILRTETAGPAVLTALQTLYGDLAE